jgi:hypothetical protein
MATVTIQKNILDRQYWFEDCKIHRDGDLPVDIQVDGTQY